MDAHNEKAISLKNSPQNTVVFWGNFFSLSKNLVFDRLAEIKEAPKTSNATPKCMWILERGALRSKSKRLAQQGILENITFGTGDPSPTLLIGCIFVF